jgi:ABC-type polysaccharide/polyol phosphate transport system ATPase subunit
MTCFKEQDMTQNNVAIAVSNLSKKYNLYNKPIDRLKESLSMGYGKVYHNDFYALNDVSFSINKGETVGIIGTNGSGKSTLLKMVTGVLRPTQGNLDVNGKVAALLELGAGFNPEYSGIENIYLNGAIMGFSKEDMDKRIEDIVSFADIGTHINQQVKTYSSGMFARLAFAVAMNVDPDIFIVDEALSVGDMFFQEKSFTKMKQFRQQGKTILFVSHSLTSVRNFCDRVIWIEKGKLVMDGHSTVVCTEYQEFMNDSRESPIEPSGTQAVNTSNKIFIKDVQINKSEFLIDDDIHITVELGFNEEITNYGLGIIIYDSKGKVVTLFNTVRDDLYFTSVVKQIQLCIPNNDFVKGKYYITLIVSDEISMFAYDRKDNIASFEVETKRNKNGIPIADGMFRSKHTWSY